MSTNTNTNTDNAAVIENANKTVFVETVRKLVNAGRASREAQVDLIAAVVDAAVNGQPIMFYSMPVVIDGESVLDGDGNVLMTEASVDYAHDVLPWAAGEQEDDGSSMFDRILSATPAGRELLARHAKNCATRDRLKAKNKKAGLLISERAELVALVGDKVNKGAIKDDAAERNRLVVSLRRALLVAAYIVEDAAHNGNTYARDTLKVSGVSLTYTAPTGDMDDKGKPVFGTYTVPQVECATTFRAKYAEWTAAPTSTEDAPALDWVDAKTEDKVTADTTADAADAADDKATGKVTPHDNSSPLGKEAAKAVKSAAGRLTLYGSVLTALAGHGVPKDGDERDALLNIASAIIALAGADAIAAWDKANAA